jgi:Ca2+-binding RTX toxin-like protein
MRHSAFLAAGLLMVLALIAGHASMANNVVPATKLNKEVSTRTIPELLPPECSSQTSTITAFVLGTAGTSANELLMGTTAIETINGASGDDCLMGGAGNDTLNGGAGSNDVCIGGPGTDTFSGCEVQYQ